MKRFARRFFLSAVGLFVVTGFSSAQNPETGTPLSQTDIAAPEIHAPARPPLNRESAATLVVYNNLNPASLDLAGYYAEKRGIPLTQLVGLSCSLNEEITREEYDRTIAEPLRKIFTERGWWKIGKTAGGTALVERNRIRFVALMFGVPLKIAPVAAYDGDTKQGQAEVMSKNEASVDSELACLGYLSRHISGVLQNPYFRSYTPFLDTSLAPLMLVGRLDAPSPALVRAMIDDALFAEKNGLWGMAYVDARGLTSGPHLEGDQWLMAVGNFLRRAGVPVVLDQLPELFPEDYPMSQAALYFGWYTDTVRGAVARNDFRFARGAVACHIHSFSASSLRDPRGQWAAPLLVHGAAATMGNVYEPFLSLTPHLDVFVDRLRKGFTFAESAYMAERAVSWMTTFVGDPLYRPFPAINQTAAEVPGAAEWIAYRDGATAWFNSREAGEKQLQQAGRTLRSGIVFEGLGLLQLSVGDAKGGLRSFALARQFYRQGDDVLRVSISETAALLSLKKNKETLTFVRNQMRAYPKAHGMAVLRAIELQLDPASATPSPR